MFGKKRKFSITDCMFPGENHLPEDASLFKLYKTVLEHVYNAYLEIRKNNAYAECQWVQNISNFVLMTSKDVHRFDISIHSLHHTVDEDSLSLCFVYLYAPRQIVETPQSNVFLFRITFRNEYAFIERMADILNTLYDATMAAPGNTKHLQSYMSGELDDLIEAACGIEDT